MKSWKVVCLSIQPPVSILCKNTFSSDYCFESSWVRLHQLYTSAFGDFLPFFLPDLLKLHQVGWGASINSNLEVFPPIFNGNQVWALAGPLKDFHVLVLKPFQCWFGFVPGIIVLLERKSSPRSQVFCTLKQVLKDLPVQYLAPFIVPSILKVSQSLPLKSIPIAWCCHHHASRSGWC